MLKYLLVIFTALTCTLMSAQTEGCTDVVACNYNELATVDDGSCEFTTDPVIDILNSNFTYDIDCNGEQWVVSVTFPEANLVIYDGVSQETSWSLCGTVLNISGLTAEWDGDSFFYSDGMDCSGNFIPEITIEVEELVFAPKKLVKVVNTMGQEVDPLNASSLQMMLIYIYDDGSVVKKMRI